MIHSNVEGRPLRAVIDRAAFKHNLNLVEQRVAPAKAIAVIKADAYGHGLIAMAEVAGSNDLAVATSDEAHRLLEGGIQNRIWILEGPFDRSCLALSEFELSKQCDLVWVVHSLWQLELLQQSALSGQINICLKIDTGMHRLGLLPDELGLAMSMLGQLDDVQLLGTVSHFASSDQVQDSTVFEQLSYFDSLLKQHALLHLPQSLANSGAILHYPQANRSWVRPGIILYGGMPDATDRAEGYGLKAVMTFESAVMALREVPAGHSVGYGATWTAKKDALIATVAGGYGDGYPRHAANGTLVAVAGKLAPLAGRVSMDMLTVDVTDLPGVKVGDPVELWGPTVSVDHVAEQSGTISYELLCGVTARVPRFHR